MGFRISSGKAGAGSCAQNPNEPDPVTSNRLVPAAMPASVKKERRLRWCMGFLTDG
jgi:hypothetical protein